MAEQRDLVAELTGSFGKWQLQAILIIFLCKIPTSWFMAVILYTSPTPQYGDVSCRLPGHLSQQQLINISVHPPLGDQHDYCRVYREIYNVTANYSGPVGIRNRSDLVACEEFEFTGDFHSVIAEFGLVCGRKLLSSFAQCFHILGLLIGGVLAFYFLKVCSPRRVMLVGMFLQIIFGSMCGLVGVYELHVLFRCLTAITCALMYTSGQMIIADITGGRAKQIVTVLFELFWSIGLILLPAVAMFFSDWSNLYLVISLPTLVLVFLHRLIPDSPRWMISQGRLDKAKSILLKAARHNNHVVPRDLDAQLESMSRKPAASQSDWFQLWRGVSQKTRVVLAIHYAWAMYILLFNSMVLNIAAYGQTHIHINTVVIAMAEIIGVFVGLYLILYTRRKWLWVGLASIFTGILANMAWTIPQHLKDTHIVALTMIPCILIKISTSATMAVLTTCSADLVPAELKRILLFSCAIWARGWFLWAPFIGATSYYGSLVPLTIFASLSVVGGLLCIVINGGDKSGQKTRPDCESRKKSVFEVLAAAVEKETFLVRGSFSSAHNDLRRVSESILRRGSMCSAHSDLKK